MKNSINLVKCVELEWAYEPITYVEEPFSIKDYDHIIIQNTEVLFSYTIYISNGKAKIVLESQYEYNGDMIEIIRNVLERTFVSIAILNRFRMDSSDII